MSKGTFKRLISKFAPLVLFAHLASLGAAQAHQLVVDHQPCIEHGDWEHSEPGESKSHEPEPHSHCATLGVFFDRTILEPSSKAFELIRPEALDSRVSWILSSAQATPAFALTEWAPKNSPPASAA